MQKLLFLHFLCLLISKYLAAISSSFFFPSDPSESNRFLWAYLHVWVFTCKYVLLYNDLFWTNMHCYFGLKAFSCINIFCLVPVYYLSFRVFDSAHQFAFYAARPICDCLYMVLLTWFESRLMIFLLRKKANLPFICLDFLRWWHFRRLSIAARLSLHSGY